MNAREQLRMLILAVLDRQPEHGYAIAQAINTRSEGLLRAREGTLYPALHRLEKQDFIRGEFQTLPRGGSPVKVYTLTPTGTTELKAQREKYERFTRAVRGVIGGPA